MMGTLASSEHCANILCAYETCSHKTGTKSPEILDSFYKFSGCFKSFYHLVQYPQWVIPNCTTYLGMGPGDKICFQNSQKTLKNHQAFLANLSWFCENRSQLCYGTPCMQTSSCQPNDCLRYCEHTHISTAIHQHKHNCTITALSINSDLTTWCPHQLMHGAIRVWLSHQQLIGKINKLIQSDEIFIYSDSF